jgi:hypothetical protein
MIHHLRHGQKAIVGSTRVIAGSVAGCAREYRDDVDESLARARKFGHELYWLNLTGTCICGDPGYYDRDAAEWSGVARIRSGDGVTIDDSPVFRLMPAPNRNYRLVVAPVCPRCQTVTPDPTDCPACDHPIEY